MLELFVSYQRITSHMTDHSLEVWIVFRPNTQIQEVAFEHHFSSCEHERLIVLRCTGSDMLNSPCCLLFQPQISIIITGHRFKCDALAF